MRSGLAATGGHGIMRRTRAAPRPNLGHRKAIMKPTNLAAASCALVTLLCGAAHADVTLRQPGSVITGRLKDGEWNSWSVRWERKPTQPSG